MQKNNTLLGIDGYIGRLPFIFNSIKAWLILLLPLCLAVYYYQDYLTQLLQDDPAADTSGEFLFGLAIVSIIYYALIFPSIVKRLRDILGKDIKKPYILAFVIIIGLSIPIVGFITGLVMISYPGVYSKQDKAQQAQ